jgi:hypothetical protein
MARAPKQAKTEFSIETILSNPVDSRTLKGFIDESIISKTKVKMENESLADIRNEAKDKLGIPPGLFNQLVRTKFNESLKADREKMEVVDDTLVSLYGEDDGANFSSEADE